MEIKQIEVYSELSNYGIVRMPGRHFPGAVIQGDSLHILCRHACSIVEGAIEGAFPISSAMPRSFWSCWKTD